MDSCFFKPNFYEAAICKNVILFFPYANHGLTSIRILFFFYRQRVSEVRRSFSNRYHPFPLYFWFINFYLTLYSQIVVDHRIIVISWKKNHLFVRIFYKEQSLYFLIVDLNSPFAGKLFRARTYTVVVAPSFQFHVVDSPAIDNYILANLTPTPLHIHQGNSSLIFTFFHIHAVIQLQSRGRSSRKKKSRRRA